MRPKLPGDDELVDHGLCRALCSKAPQASLLGILLRNSVAGTSCRNLPPLPIRMTSMLGKISAG